MDPLTVGALAVSAISTGFGIFGGVKVDNDNSKAIEAQYEYDMEMYEFDLEERDRLYDYTMDQTDIARTILRTTSTSRSRLVFSLGSLKRK